ncbi:ParB/RepB/Spo0J family partition protein [Rhizobium panacihumi]|uniref:ParB/RepB/Spo0J family partition protein n=1 Tax=Rhizobium panacihumi TaxID=2008450 RepID=UPI003D79D398
MTEIISIPLNKLDADPKNVRKTYTSETVEALAASILANGVVQNIVVRKGAKGRFLVTAGGRRRAALLLLAERGDIAADYAVNAMVKAEADATEISLTENVMREGMHPADQYEAFKAMADAGKSIKDIAARFGTTEIIVNRRLALAKVAPVLFEAFRAEEMKFEQLAAFTITDDHARQVEVWNSLTSWDRDAQTIKRRLTAEEVPAHDKRLTLIGGLSVYEAAGGPVRRDLFSGNGGGYACDSGLLERLVAEKLEAEAEAVRAEGWKWVECASQQPDIWGMARVHARSAELSDDDQAKLDALSVRYDELAAIIDAEEDNQAAEAELIEVENQMEVLQNREKEFLADDKATAGAYVTIDHYGKLSIIRGLIRDEDVKAQPTTDAASEKAGDDAKPETASLIHSAVLVEDLTAQKTAALRVELANNHSVALVSVVHAMLLNVLYPGQYGAKGMTALEISTTHQRLEGSMKRPETCRAAIEWERIAENYGHQIPGNPADLWDYLLDLRQDELLGLLAFAAAHTLNAVETKHSFRKEAIAHAGMVGRTLDVDMRDWFETTADSYFSMLNRGSIQAAVAEVRGADFAAGIGGMKKAEAAAYAENAIKGKNWLPSNLRFKPEEAAEAETPGEDAHDFPMAAE